MGFLLIKYGGNFMKVRLAISPCPNDLFVFYKVLKESAYEVTLEEIHKLNNIALRGEADVVKISAAIFGDIKDKYLLLDAGSAFGINDGPIVVSKREITADKIKILAVPGKSTTAYMLYRKIFGEAPKILETTYDGVINLILEEKADAGILIHEGRLLFPTYGLKLVVDLFKIWQDKTKGLPLPLGLIVMRKELKENLKKTFEEKIRESIEYSNKNKKEVLEFIMRKHPHLKEDLIEKYLKSFVNDYTYSIGKRGAKALEILLDT